MDAMRLGPILFGAGPHKKISRITENLSCKVGKLGLVFQRRAWCVEPLISGRLLLKISVLGTALQAVTQNDKYGGGIFFALTRGLRG